MEPRPPGPAASTDEDAIPVLDPAPLHALFTPDDPDVLSGFVEQFLADGPDRLRRLLAAFEGGNAAGLRAAAHAFKGSASYMGARRLAAACGKLEQAATAGELAGAGALLQAVEDEFRAARAALEQFVAQSPSA
jgi:HPt (histidine-containing phosphotransfer) domain-containing protein